MCVGAGHAARMLIAGMARSYISGIPAGCNFSLLLEDEISWEAQNYLEYKLNLNRLFTNTHRMLQFASLRAEKLGYNQ